MINPWNSDDHVIRTLASKLEPEPNSGCWITTTSLNSGYGQLMINGVQKLTHRWSYEQLVGPVPAGLVLDHKCRNRACANPDHLEPVTNRENILRGTGGSARNARKTACAAGHAYSEHAYVWRSKKRQCRVCKMARRRTDEFRATRRVERKAKRADLRAAGSMKDV